ncbi:MAG: ATP-grasp domain-containing protein, partial [Thermoplasmata archaeon]
KTAMPCAIRCWKKSQLPTPEYRFYELDNLNLNKIDWNVFPCIVKPSFVGGGSRGVRLIKCKDELSGIIESYKAFSSNHHLILEEFIEGTEHTIEVLIWEGKTQLMSISDKKNYPGSVTIVQDLMFPGPKGNRFREQLEILLDEACKSLGLEYGCAHFEVIIDKEDKIWLIEVGGRPGGGLNFQPISVLSTGFDYPLEYASIITTGKPKLKKANKTYKLYWHFFNGFNGVLHKVEGWDLAVSNEDVIESGLLIKPGEKRFKEFANDLERPGHILFKYNTLEDLKNKLEFFDSTVKFLST